MFKPRWYCGRRTVELLEDRLLRVVVRLLRVEECNVFVARVVGALVESKCQEDGLTNAPRPPESVWNVEGGREDEFEDNFGGGAEPCVA